MLWAGEVLFALNVAGFPPELDQEIITEIMRGGTEKVLSAGAVVAGGHTVQDEEPKYGLAVTGIVHPLKYFTKGGAKPDDVLILTKPIGTGTISTALKRDVAQAKHVTEMVTSMKQLNQSAAPSGPSRARYSGCYRYYGFWIFRTCHGNEPGRGRAI